MKMRLKSRFLLNLQILFGFLFFPLLYGGIVLFMKKNAYRIKNLKAIRQQYRLMIKGNQSPQVICANHLTYVDSILIAYALGDFKTLFFNFRHLPWNLPKKSNVSACWYYPLLCYLGKCLQLPKDIKGARKVLDKTLWLLDNKQTILLFPEGTRSDAGIIQAEKVGYGVGELIDALSHKQALLIYLRGEDEDSKSKYPKKNQDFYMRLELTAFEVCETGRRARRQIAQDVISNLKQLEDEYFEYRQ